MSKKNSKYTSKKSSHFGDGEDHSPKLLTRLSPRSPPEFSVKPDQMFEYNTYDTQDSKNSKNSKDTNKDGDPLGRIDQEQLQAQLSKANDNKRAPTSLYDELESKKQIGEIAFQPLVPRQYLNASLGFNTEKINNVVEQRPHHKAQLHCNDGLIVMGTTALSKLAVSNERSYKREVKTPQHEMCKHMASRNKGSTATPTAKRASSRMTTP